MTPEQESRLRMLGTSSVVGGDIRAAVEEIDRLRVLVADAVQVMRNFGNTMPGEWKVARARFLADTVKF
jgi:hypothetical protein